MKAYKLFIVIALVSMIAPFGALAQNGETSPYTMFGYGSLSDYASGAQRAMGGVGYATNNGRQINVKNPASYAHCDSLTFLLDFGVDFTGIHMSENGNSGKSFGGGLEYITMQFPLSKTVGGSIGLLPYSSVGYSFGSGNNDDSTNEIAGGSGGINMLYVGLSWMPFNNFSIGANVSYNFGNITRSISTGATVDDESVQSIYERKLKVRDWGLQFGAQYDININDRNTLTIGAVYAPQKSLHGNAEAHKYDSSSSESQGVVVDTISDVSMKDRFSTPATYGGGLSWTHDKKLTLAADFTYQNWADAKYDRIENLETMAFDNRWKVAAGVSYVPNPRGNFFKRTTYRLGMHYNRDYVKVHGSNVRDYGVSFGFGLPAPSSKTLINIGFEYKRREAYPTKFITENYYCITIGINFNEMWFWQNKIK